MSVWRLAIISFTAAALAACASVPITSLPRLVALDPRTLDPSGVEVAIRVPEAVEITRARLTYRGANGLTGEEVGDSYELTFASAELTPFLQRQGTRNRRIERYRLSEDQAQAVAAARDRALTWSDAADAGQRRFTMSAEAGMCSRPGAEPLQELSLTIYLRERPDREFFTLVSERRFDVDSIPSCAG